MKIISLIVVILSGLILILNRVKNKWVEDLLFVISPKKYNAKVGLIIVCPITSQVKNYPFEVSLPETNLIQGVIISDQIKSLDYKIGDTEFIEIVETETLQNVINKISLLIF